MLADSVSLAAEERVEAQFDAELDQILSTLLAHYQEVTANPRSMGYLRSLLKHYAKDPHPWRACFTADTPIDCPRDHARFPDGVPISQVKLGDLVWSFNVEAYVFELKPITWASMTRRKAQLAMLTLDDGSQIKATPDHQFMRRDTTWAEALDLRVGDWLLAGEPGTSDCSGLSASLAVALAGVGSVENESGVIRPEVAMDAAAGITLSDQWSLEGVVVRDDLENADASTCGHHRVDGAHDASSSGPVYTPLPSGSRCSEVFPGASPYIADTEEDGLQAIKRLAFVLGSSDNCVGASEGVGPITPLSGSPVPPEASLSLKESSGPREIDGRQVTEVRLLDEREDVWDIEVSGNHNFLVSGVVVHNCYKDNLRRFGPKTAALCGVLKDSIRQSTHWRGHPALDHGSPGVAIAEADKSAAPPFGGHHGLKLDADIPIGPGDEVQRSSSDLTLVGPRGTVIRDHVAPDDGAIIHDIGWSDGTESEGVRETEIRRLSICIPDEIVALLSDLAENCDPCRVMLGLDPAPHPSDTFLARSAA